ncbi:DUF747-domain-containing protein [Aulographum hederae CBS 113979]|uniref:DUF747-domain-containing protein n=1 Tax=Aulographum hederae CBS 113979 TaxID=1176131 RepID=A0A6G1GMI7_9PEZI|nr:DUF747-domain-containing protein [Aulographum hederae CBS 113979]
MNGQHGDGGVFAEHAPQSPHHGQLRTPSLSPSLDNSSRQYDTETAPNGTKTPGIKQTILEVDAPEEAGLDHGPREGVDARLQVDGSSESKLSPPLSPSRDERRKRSIGKLSSPASGPLDSKILKLSPTKIQELTSSPTSLPVRAASPIPEEIPLLADAPEFLKKEEGGTSADNEETLFKDGSSSSNKGRRPSMSGNRGQTFEGKYTTETPNMKLPPLASKSSRPSASRTVSTPPFIRRKHSSHKAHAPLQEAVSSGTRPASRTVPPPLNLKDTKENRNAGPATTANLKPLPTPIPEQIHSPVSASLPVPPLSIPTYLQLELSTDKPSPLYIHRSATADYPYESIEVKFERLKNFLFLPVHLEQVIIFGVLACLDSFLHTFTILPLRFLNALFIFALWWVRNGYKETKDLGTFIYLGLGRLWERRRARADGTVSEPPSRPQSRRPSHTDILPAPPLTARENRITLPATQDLSRKSSKSSHIRHRRTRSTPSTLKSSHKADLLKGALIIASCAVLMRFDASRMYHNIRGQAAIKLYVIYNVLEISDRLFASVGQDILEVLLSDSTLSRNADGRSKVFRPLVLFLLALAYNCIHATSLFYQVITLNVAVNSYSNALIVLLLSNQFVEIKGSVFKKFEKENLFQLACADVVERFQLCLMLIIIAMRNIVEVGGFTISLASSFVAGPTNTGSSTSSGFEANATAAPRFTTSIIPQAFTILPPLLGQVLAPFLLVLGSEMLVDALKHAYISKFNNISPRALYGRFLDVLAKDYYAHAFADQNLTKRLGLPVLPLACLFIRASTQTYHMFLATHVPLPMMNPATGISLGAETTDEGAQPATTAILAQIDIVFRRALGRSSFGAGPNDPANQGFSWWSIDDFIAFATMAAVALVAWGLMLVFKLLLGMALVSYSRGRYRRMKDRERQEKEREKRVETEGKRVGGWGVVEVGDEKRRHIYSDDPEGYKRLKEKGKKKDGSGVDLDAVGRYDMVAKRIW